MSSLLDAYGRSKKLTDRSKLIYDIVDAARLVTFDYKNALLHVELRKAFNALDQYDFTMRATSAKENKA
jgi:hypothetical protein